MTVRFRVLAGAALATGLLGVVLASAAPATAAPVRADQTLPTIPVDQLLPLIEPLQPVLELISPIAWPACGDAVLVTVLPGALGIEVPPELAVVLGPLLVLCGSVPQPEGNGRVCALDTAAQQVIAEALKSSLGSLPVEVKPVNWLSGLVTNLVDLVGIPIGSTVDAVFMCVAPPGAVTTTTAPSPPSTDATPVDLPTAFDPPTFAELQTLPPVDLSARPKPAAVVEVDAPQVRFIDEPRFRYPIVMGLPLLFLGLLVFFGRALTRPLQFDKDGGS